MKIEKTIEFLKGLKYINPQNSMYNIKTNEVMNLAIEVLERQIPRKVSFDADGPYCRACHTHIEGTFGRYCDYCGQAIDWEVSE